ncbi:T9SS type A sorting domain-containing protein [Weeksella virosa]|uniref:T9SS type A sorting domain-containing protein n=1 Tax=Weeksella virosa TaxID=1014 RepID=UPI003D732C6B
MNRLEILDTNGRVVRAYSKKNTISLKSLLKGVYFVKIYFSDGKAVTQKIIKQ